MKRPDGQLFIGLVRGRRVEHTARVHTVVRSHRLRQLDNGDCVIQNDDFWLCVFHQFHLLSVWDSSSAEKALYFKVSVDSARLRSTQSRYPLAGPAVFAGGAGGPYFLAIFRLRACAIEEQWEPHGHAAHSPEHR